MSNITRRDLMAGAAGLAAAGALGARTRRGAVDPDLHAGGGRLAAHAALGAVRPGRRGGLESQHRRLHRGDRRGGADRRGELGGRAPEGRRRRQCRLRAGHGDELVRRPLPVSRQAHRRDRARRARSARRTAAGTTAPRGYAVRDGKFIAMPLCAIGNAICYRDSHVKAAGFSEFPNDSAGFLELCKAMQGQQHPGRLPARQGGGRRQQLRPLAALEQRRQDDQRGRHGRHRQRPRPARRSSTPRSSTPPSSPAPRAGSTSTTTAPSSPGRCR